MIGQYFLNQIMKSPVVKEPWEHQIVNQTLTDDVYATLQEQCQQFLHYPTNGKLELVAPDQFKDRGITLYDEIYDIGKTIYDNVETLTKGTYSNPRWYDGLTVYAHLSITPPLPYKFHIHEEGLEKIWSSVTYITPDKNVGTKMYTKNNESSFVKEAPWIPNSTFIFCGQQGKTWHSYESSQATNRITLNFFVMSDKRGKRFI